MKKPLLCLMLGLTFISVFSGCQKHSDSDFEDLIQQYDNLQFRYDELKDKYEILQNEMAAEYMTPDDYYNLSSFASSISFRNTNFYSTAYCIVLETGAETTIRIGFESEGTVQCEQDNDHCDADWGNFDDYGLSPFTIKGVSEGITYFTFTNDVDNRTFQIVVFVVD